MKKQTFKVITYNLDNNPDGHRLAESCQKYGYDLALIGQGHGFKNFRQLKIDLLLQELMMVKEDFVMFTDGLDSWFLRDDILKLYKKFKSPVVISGNRDHYPASNLYRDYPKANTSFRFICSSQFIGETKEVIGALALIQHHYSGMTDQEGWNALYANKLLPNTVIDHECRLFLNMTQVDLKELDPKFKLKETGNIPASIHFGGPKGGDPNYQNMLDMFEKWRFL